MITIDLGTIEYFDESTNEFTYEHGGIVRFEYSLKALYNWEGKWKKPFLKGGLTEIEVVDFYMMMALDPIKIEFMTVGVIEKLQAYIEDSHTATTFSVDQDGQNGNKTSGKGKIHTAEEFYALMVTARVPLEFENRNLNRLMVILRIIDTYNKPPKKMSQQEIFKQNASLNEKRKALLKSRG